MTPAQLDRLATEVMGWRKEIRTFWTSSFRYAEVTDWCWVDDKGAVQPVDYWIPHTSLNQTLPLLDKFNGDYEKHRNFIGINNSSPDYWEIHGSKNNESPKVNIYNIRTKGLASTLCDAILERLE